MRRARVILLALSCVAPACGDGGDPAPASDATVPDAGPPPEPDPFVEVSAGEGHTCARRESGEVWCWGRNDRGQLGDGTRVSRGEPRPVEALDDAVQLGLGGDTSCAMRAGGEAVCWGDWPSAWDPDAEDERATERESDRLSPEGLAVGGVVDVAAGPRGHICVARADGGVSCADDLTSEASFEDVDGVGDAVEVSLHGGRPCALLADGGAVCVGTFSHPPGDGTTTTGGVVGGPVGGYDDVVAVSGSCILREGGALECWGLVAERLGLHPEDGLPLSPIAVPGMDDAVELHGDCVLRRDRGITCLDARVGWHPESPHWAPAPLPATRGAVGFAVGRWYELTADVRRRAWRHVCHVTGAGSVGCAGWDGCGQLGRGSVPAALEAVAVGGLPPVAELSVAADQTCARTVGGEVRCWGVTGPWRPVEPAPVAVSVPFDAAAVRAGIGGGCALDGVGAVACWGVTPFFAYRVDAPTPVTGVPPLIDLALSSTDGRCYASPWCPPGGFAVVITEEGSFHASVEWESHDPESELPRLTEDREDATGAEIGREIVCTLFADGWQRCDGEVSVSLEKGRDVDAGRCGACRVDLEGRVRCHQRRSGFCIDTSWAEEERQPIPGLENVLEVATADGMACARPASGAVRCWGVDGHGGLGTLDATPVRNPRAIPGTAGAVQLVVGDHHGCVRMDDGEVRCWGWNGLGQLGSGRDPQVASPVEVLGAYARP